MLSITTSMTSVICSNDVNKSKYKPKRLIHMHKTKKTLYKLMKENMDFIETNCEDGGEECDNAWERVHIFSKAIKDVQNTIHRLN